MGGGSTKKLFGNKPDNDGLRESAYPPLMASRIRISSPSFNG
jgi:hypothetical protein